MRGFRVYKRKRLKWILIYAGSSLEEAAKTVAVHATLHFMENSFDKPFKVYVRGEKWWGVVRSLRHRLKKYEYVGVRSGRGLNVYWIPYFADSNYYHGLTFKTLIKWHVKPPLIELVEKMAGGQSR